MRFLIFATSAIALALSAQSNQSPVILRAETLENRASLLHGQGKAEMRGPTFILRADEIDFDRQQNTAVARGNVQIKLTAKDVRIRSENLSSRGTPLENFRGNLTVLTDHLVVQGQDIEYLDRTNEILTSGKIHLKLVESTAK